MKGRNDAALLAARTFSDQLIHIVRRVRQVKITIRARDQLELSPPLLAHVYVSVGDALEEMRRRDVVILDDRAALQIMKQFQAQLPADRVMIDEDVVRLAQE